MEPLTCGRAVHAASTFENADGGAWRCEMCETPSAEAWLSILVVVETELKEIEKIKSPEKRASTLGRPPLKLYFTATRHHGFSL